MPEMYCLTCLSQGPLNTHTPDKCLSAIYSAERGNEPWGYIKRRDVFLTSGAISNFISALLYAVIWVTL
jgi:hypothetical protein